jgi:hypothetical protein
MVGSRASLVQHAPTKTVFEIFARPDLSQDDSLALEDFARGLCMGARARSLPPMPISKCCVVRQF